MISVSNSDYLIPWKECLLLSVRLISIQYNFKVGITVLSQQNYLGSKITSTYWLYFPNFISFKWMSRHYWKSKLADKGNSRNQCKIDNTKMKLQISIVVSSYYWQKRSCFTSNNCFFEVKLSPPIQWFPIQSTCYPN